MGTDLMEPRRLSLTMLRASLALIGACAAMPAYAQAIDAGDYVPAPPGTKLALVYLRYSHSGAVYAKGEKVDDKAELETAVSIMRYVGFTKIAGMTLDYQ